MTKRLIPLTTVHGMLQIRKCRRETVDFNPPAHRRFRNAIKYEQFVNYIHEVCFFAARATEAQYQQDHLTVLAKTQKNAKISDNSVNLSNNDTNCSHVSQVSNTSSNTSISTVCSTNENVGFEPQGLFIQYVMENLRACHFWLKPENEPLPSTANASGVPLFRNLFFPSPEEMAEFERMLEEDFYVLLMKAIGISKRDRRAFKRDFFTFLYNRAFIRYAGKRYVEREDGSCGFERIPEPVRLAMVTLLPSIVLFLDICKWQPGTLDREGNDYKKLSYAIQSIESQIMLECCANLWKQ